MEPLQILIKQASDKNGSKTVRHQAFSQIVNLFYENANRWALSRIDDPMLAQDIVQEGFVIAFQKLDTLREPKAFPGWLRQIIFSQSARYTRKKEIKIKSFEQTEDLPTEEKSLDKSIEEAELKEKVVDAIAALPEKEKIVTQLFYLYGYSQKEIAKLLAIPVTTVKKRLQYARGNLRGLLAFMVESLSYNEPQPQLEPIPIPVESYPHNLPRNDEW